MIQLTRLNRSSVTVNSDLIKFIEQSPDTVITLANGEKLLVRETTDEILDRIVKFRRSIVHGHDAKNAATELALNPEVLDSPSGTSSGKAGGSMPVDHRHMDGIVPWHRRHPWWLAS